MICHQVSWKSTDKSSLNDVLHHSGEDLMISKRIGPNINWLLLDEDFPSLPRMRYPRKN